MNRLVTAAIAAGTMVLLTPAAPAAASDRPTVDHAVETGTSFPDDLILEVCGIAVTTTFHVKTVTQMFADGSQMVHVVATFQSDDPRVAMEKDAFAGHVTPDGATTVTGVGTRLIDQISGRTIEKDRGRITYGPAGDILSVDGPHPLTEIEDLATVYCPSLV